MNQVQLTPEQLTEIRARVEATTPVPWRLWDDGTSLFVHIPAVNGHICITQLDSRDRRGNMTFVAHAHQDVPNLLDELAKANAKIADLEAALEASANALKKALILIAPERYLDCSLDVSQIQEAYIKCKAAIAKAREQS